MSLFLFIACPFLVHMSGKQTCFVKAAVIRSQVNTLIPHAGLVGGFIDVGAPKQLLL